MRTAVLAAVTALCLAGCQERDTAAGSAENGPGTAAEFDVLPPDESVATPNELENGTNEDANATDLQRP